MREFPLSNVERSSVLQSFQEGKRFDGRHSEQGRRISIVFGVRLGSCLVQVGNTKVLTSVSCHACEPKPGRPTEGHLFVNVEVSRMTAPHIEPMRAGVLGNEVTRILERCIKEARCLDTESLCIVAGEKVWELRLDVHLLDHDGSLTDCAQLAAIAALKHFRRPDVTVIGEEVTIHDTTEKEPVPLNLYHLPICVTIGYASGCLVLDPTDREEKVLDGKVIVGLNTHREICTLHCAGDMLLKKDEITRCVNLAAERVDECTELIKSKLAENAEFRSKRKIVGFQEHIAVDRVTGLYFEALKIPPGPSYEDSRPEKEESSPEHIPALDTSLIDRLVDKESKTVTVGGSPDHHDLGLMTSRITKANRKKKASKHQVASEMDFETIPNPEKSKTSAPTPEKSLKSETKKSRKKTKRPVLNDEVNDLLDDIESDVMVLEQADTV